MFNNKKESRQHLKFGVLKKKKYNKNTQTNKNPNLVQPKIVLMEIYFSF